MGVCNLLLQRTRLTKLNLKTDRSVLRCGLSKNPVKIRGNDIFLGLMKYINLRRKTI